MKRSLNTEDLKVLSSLKAVRRIIKKDADENRVSVVSNFCNDKFAGQHYSLSFIYIEIHQDRYQH